MAEDERQSAGNERIGKRERIALKILLYLLSALILVGLCFTGSIVYEIMQPRGEMMAMTLISLSPVMLLLGAMVIGLILWRGKLLSKTEQWVFRIVGIGTLVLFAMLWIFG